MVGARVPRSNMLSGAQRQRSSRGIQTTSRQLASAPEKESKTWESDGLVNV